MIKDNVMQDTENLGIRFENPISLDCNETLVLVQPEYSDWECQLFGMKDTITVNPIIGNVPNFFWHWMQFFFFGNRWRKIGKETG